MDWLLHELEEKGKMKESRKTKDREQKRWSCASALSDLS